MRISALQELDPQATIRLTGWCSNRLFARALTKRILPARTQISDRERFRGHYLLFPWLIPMIKLIQFLFNSQLTTKNKWLTNGNRNHRHACSERSSSTKSCSDYIDGGVGTTSISGRKSSRLTKALMAYRVSPGR